MKSIAVVGAGISGLVTAYRLFLTGFDVTVYEAAPRIGGVIETISENGFLCDLGPNSILDSSPEIGELMEEIGFDATEKLAASTISKNRYIARFGRPVAAPAGPGSFLSTPLFSAGAKVRLFAEPFLPGGGSPDESLASFVRRRLGREILDYAVNPFVAGVYAGDPEKLSLRHAFPKLHELEKEGGSLVRGMLRRMMARRAKTRRRPRGVPRIFSFRSGMGALCDRIAELLGERIRTRTNVRSIVRSAGRWRLSIEANEVEHDAVVLAVPAHVLPAIRFEGPGLDTLARLGEIAYPPVASVCLGFRRRDVRHPLDGYGVLIPQSEPFRVLGALFSSSLFPGRAPDDHVLLTVFAGGARNPELGRAPVESIARTALEDLEQLLGIAAAPVYTRTTLYEKAIPQYEIGYDRFLSVIDAAENANPGFFLVGTYRDGISVGDAIVKGCAMATRVGESLRG